MVKRKFLEQNDFLNFPELHNFLNETLIKNKAFSSLNAASLSSFRTEVSSFSRTFYYLEIFQLSSIFKARTLYPFGMDNSPFECPLCLVPYGAEALPACLPCGHVCCFEHIKGLTSCFQCNVVIKGKNAIRPCGTMRDAADLYHKLIIEYHALTMEIETAVIKESESSRLDNTELVPSMESVGLTDMPKCTIDALQVPEIQKAVVIDQQDKKKDEDKGKDDDEEWIIDMDLESRTSSVVESGADESLDDLSEGGAQCDLDSQTNTPTQKAQTESLKTDLQSTKVSKDSVWQIGASLASKLKVSDQVQADYENGKLPRSSRAKLPTAVEESALLHLHPQQPKQLSFCQLMDVETARFQYTPIPDYEYSDFFGSFGDVQPPLSYEEKRMLKRKKKALADASAKPFTQPKYLGYNYAVQHIPGQAVKRFEEKRREAKRAPRVGFVTTTVKPARLTVKREILPCNPSTDEKQQQMNLGNLFHRVSDPSGQCNPTLMRSVPAPWPGGMAVGKSCGHWCCPSSLDRCCHCADRRPQQRTYLKYVDGVGVTYAAARSANYCPVCKSTSATCC